MAWCHQATSHYLNQCWHSSPMHICIIRPPYIDELVQERCNSIANALELRLSCTISSICVQVFSLLENGSLRCWGVNFEVIRESNLAPFDSKSLPRACAHEIKQQMWWTLIGWNVKAFCVLVVHLTLSWRTSLRKFGNHYSVSVHSRLSHKCDKLWSAEMCKHFVY